MNHEHHIIVLWHNALEEKQRILEEVENNFHIISSNSIQWSKENVANNLLRLYGPEASLLGEKEEVIGDGPFLVLVVQDEHPLVRQKVTTSGVQLVNENILNFKESIRASLPNKWLIHTSVNQEEAQKDVHLLLHRPLQDVILKPSHHSEVTTKKDLLGASSFASLEEVFSLLNSSDEYIILFKNAHAHKNGKPIDLAHGSDIDLLSTDHLKTAGLLNAQLVSSTDEQPHYFVSIAGCDVKFDLRDSFDSYFCPVWSRSAIAKRELHNGIYLPQQDDQFFLSCYHYLIHKNGNSETYKYLYAEADKLGYQSSDNDQLFYILRKHMISKAYCAPAPRDPGVMVNPDFQKSLVRKSFMHISEASSDTDLASGIAIIKKQWNGASEKIIRSVVSTPPHRHKKSEGYYESKVWKVGVPVPGIGIIDLCLKAEQFFDPNMRKHALGEAVNVMTELDCQYIPKFVGYVITENILFTCAEWIEGKTLSEHFDEIALELSVSDETNRFEQSFYSYLDYLKRLRISHRDIWEKNIIVRRRRSVFIDFTWSCRNNHSEYYPENALYPNDEEAVNRLLLKFKQRQQELRIS